MICKQCGADLPDESHFCPYCMAQFGENGNHSSKRHSKKRLILLGAAAVIAVAIAVILILSHKEPSQLDKTTNETDTNVVSTEEPKTANINGDSYESGTYYWDIDGNGDFVLKDYEDFPY